MKFLKLLIVPLLFSQTAQAADISEAGFVLKKSEFSVKETLDRLQGSIEANENLKVLARIDHSKNAENSGLELLPTELLVFGNPKLGTKLMQSARSISADLPMKVAVWKEANGDIILEYLSPEALVARHNITDQSEIVAKMTAALDKLTDKAIKD